MAPVLSTLRHQQTFDFLAQFVRSQPRPADVAKCIQAWIKASEVLHLNKKTEATAKIFVCILYDLISRSSYSWTVQPKLPQALKNLFYPSPRNGNLGPLDRNVQTTDNQATLDWELILAVIHYQCRLCGFVYVFLS